MARSTLEGVAELTKQLNQLKSLDEGRALKLAVRAGIKPALERAMTIIPVGHDVHRAKVSKRLAKAGVHGMTVPPGFARASLRIITTINSAKNIASGLLSVRKAAYYAVKFVEFGTRKMPAQPWIRRALLESRSDCEEAFRDSIQRAVERAAAKQ